MLGLWVYAVVLVKHEYGLDSVEGINSFYAKKSAALDKVVWLNSEIKKFDPDSRRHATFQRVMFFRGKLKGGEFSDRCTICAKELAEGALLSEPQKSSIDKP
jgi:hypothetical protein